MKGLEPGAILVDKYRVDRVLGAGGMGVVLAAHHLHLDQPVAIKTLLPEMLVNEEAVERFVREARAAVRIKSEHVARVSDVGRLESGAPYMVMEYLEGQDLAQRLAEGGPLEVEQAVEFVLQACEALAEAHAMGIVHRDLKPANLFCVRRADGLLSVKLLDFGISKAANAPGELGMTKTTAVMGSPYYMSPEQMLSAKNADVQSDIWSLGAVLFELLTGYVPFAADTLPELVLRVSSSPAPNLADLRTNVPLGLRDIVSCCLERDRSRRYANVAELAKALTPFGHSERARNSSDRISRVIEAAGLASSRPSHIALDQTQTHGTPPSAPIPGGQRGASATVGTFGQTAGPTLSSARRSGRGARLAFGLGGAVLLLGGALWYLLGQRTEPAGGLAPVAATPAPLPAPLPAQLSGAPATVATPAAGTATGSAAAATETPSAAAAAAATGSATTAPQSDTTPAGPAPQPVQPARAKAPVVVRSSATAARAPVSAPAAPSSPAAAPTTSTSPAPATTSSALGGRL
ncbi:MAG TPA: serine/threonine-protein kinase [Polyangiaceae bacterium]|nr:serine/threonine-protein kinase [Polyangiaceae bacterium]